MDNEADYASLMVSSWTMLSNNYILRSPVNTIWRLSVVARRSQPPQVFIPTADVKRFITSPRPMSSLIFKGIRTRFMGLVCFGNLI